MCQLSPTTEQMMILQHFRCPFPCNKELLQGQMLTIRR